MNGRHLPAGQQNMQQDMGRRRPYNQNQQYPLAGPMYNGYMQPYQANYYPQQQYPPQHYHNPNMPPPYAPYPPYVRSPPPVMQHYAHPPIPQQNFPRPQPSPAMVPPYQPPPPQTPPSTHSSYTIPAPMTPPTPHTSFTTASPQAQPTRSTFRAPVSRVVPHLYCTSLNSKQLPWLSHPDVPWPARKSRRKKKQAPQLSTDPVELPTVQQEQPGPSAEIEEPTATEPTIPRPETPSSRPASEATESTNPTTPSSTQQPSLPAPNDTTPVAPKPTKSALPAVPVIPALPKAAVRDASKQLAEKPIQRPTQEAQSQKVAPEVEQTENKAESTAADEAPAEEAKAISPPPNAWAKPKAWAGLFNPAAVSSAASSNGGSAAVPTLGKSNAESLAEALRSFDAASNDSKIAFLEPRGLVNTGNMCYMNSVSLYSRFTSNTRLTDPQVLQVLVFCTPFYSFLDQVGKRAAHSFKSDTPLLDAM